MKRFFEPPELLFQYGDFISNTHVRDIVFSILVKENTRLVIKSKGILFTTTKKVTIFSYSHMY